MPKEKKKRLLKLVLAIVILFILLLLLLCSCNRNEQAATQNTALVPVDSKEEVKEPEEKEEVEENKEEKDKTDKDSETEPKEEQAQEKLEVLDSNSDTVDVPDEPKEPLVETNASKPVETVAQVSNDEVIEASPTEEAVPEQKPEPEPTPTPQPVHEHTWVKHDATGHYETKTVQEAYTETIHHDEEGHYETVIVKEAWDETVEEEVAVGHGTFCRACELDFTAAGFTETDAIEHCKQHALNGEMAGYYDKDVYETVTKTVHHDAVTEEKWVVDKAAYDEEIKHDAVTEQVWVEDTPSYEECSGCGERR